MKKFYKTELILNYMKENNLSKTAFSKKCGINPQILNKILNNQLNFGCDALFKVARVLKLQIRGILEK